MDKHKIVVGLGFGDEGKGTIVDYLCSQESYGAVVRFSGGPQAAHNVVTPEGIHHTFSQFGSGTFTETPTILSRYMLVNPLNLAKEAEELDSKLGFNPFDLLCVSENSLVVTPYHIEANRMREKERGEDRHGSCGQGVGETQSFALEYPDFALRMKDLEDRQTMVVKLSFIKSLLEAQVGQIKVGRSSENIATMYEFFLIDHPDIIRSDEWITDFISNNTCVFEGSQGVLLDEWKGFHPYTTWSTTTDENARALLREASVDESNVETIGVTRTYQTRHGDGPLPTEIDNVEDFPEAHNDWGEFQGGWRVGNLDLSLLKYSSDMVGKLDEIALTHTDVMEYTLSMHPYDLTAMYEDKNLDNQEKITKVLFNIQNHQSEVLIDIKNLDDRLLIAWIELITGAKVTTKSYGPRRDQKETCKS